MKILQFFLCFHFSIAVIAQSDTIHSKVLKEDRFVWVRLPGNVTDKSSLKKSFPVVYILDAEANFKTTIEILNRLHKVTSHPVFSEVIVVGVGNIWLRDRDYTPTHITASLFVDSMAAKQSGGGENFVLFLEKELIPYINSKYPASASRVLIGHSLGGLTVMNIMLNHTKLFNGYAAIDPSMWWDDHKLLDQSRVILSTANFEHISLFLAIANTMEKEMNDVLQIKKDTSKKTVLIRPAITLADYLQANQQNKLRFSWKYYRNENHMSVYAKGVSDALEFVLKTL